jgi:hypothetical protein
MAAASGIGAGRREQARGKKMGARVRPGGPRGVLSTREARRMADACGNGDVSTGAVDSAREMAGGGRRPRWAGPFLTVHRKPSAPVLFCPFSFSFSDFF